MSPTECITQEPLRSWIPLYLIISTIVGLGLAYFCWRHRNVPGVNYIALSQVASAGWTLVYLLEFTAFPNLVEAKIWQLIKAIFVYGLPVALLLGALAYIGKAVHRPLVVGLTVSYLAWISFFLTNPLHSLVYIDPHFYLACPYPSLAQGPGPIWYPSFAYHGILIFFFSGILFYYTIQVSPIYRGQLLILSSGYLLATTYTMFRGLGVSFNIPLSVLDEGAIGQGIAHIFFLIGIIFFKLFRSSPLGWASIAEYSSDLIVTVDKEKRIAEMNPAARKHFGISSLLQPINAIAPAISENLTGEILLGKETYMVKPAQIPHAKNTAGWMLSFQDVTELKKLQQELRYQSTHDDLTGLLNRRYFNQTLPTLVKDAEQRNSTLSVIVMDVDNFRNFNHQHGHEGGDFVLQEVAKLIRQHTYKHEFAFRHGGEEFSLVLPGTGLYHATFRAIKLCEDIASRQFPFADKSLSITASFGVASYEVHGEDFFNKADDAMGLAKGMGRNQVYQAIVLGEWHRGWA